GELATYTPFGGAAAPDIAGIFNDPHLPVDGNDAGVSDFQPTFLCRSVDLPAGAAGGDAGIYNPVRLPPAHRRWYRRNHRKLAVIDGATGFIGGFGFWNAWAANPPRGRWDVGARVRGPVAAQFRSMFAHD
ncbi:MAG: hypothetical protein AAB368_01860, partial [bacterium]